MAAKGERSETGTAAKVLDIAERLIQTTATTASATRTSPPSSRSRRRACTTTPPARRSSERRSSNGTRRFLDALAAIDVRPTEAFAKLDAYAQLYADVLRGKRMCLCGMLAAEYQTLPKPMRNSVIRFFDQNEAWLEKVLVQGREEGTLEFTGSAKDAAR